MFCKYLACEKDCRKTRKYPLADDIDARGACCRICDKKFIIRELSVNKWSVPIEVLNEGIQNRLNQLTQDGQMLDDTKKEEQSFKDDFDTQVALVTKKSDIKEIMKKLTQKVFENRMKFDAMTP